MRIKQLASILCIVFITLIIIYYSAPSLTPHKIIELPNPELSSNISLERALNTRRSTREFTNKAISLQQLEQLLWAAQGVTTKDGMRTAPSAGPTYPLDVYIAVKNVTGLAAGVYLYLPEKNSIEQLSTKNVTNDIYIASDKQEAILQSSIVIIMTGEYDRTTKKYGTRGVRYVHLEAGAATENIALQATVLHLGIVTMGGFDDDLVEKALGISNVHTPFFIIPVGTIS